MHGLLPESSALHVEETSVRRLKASVAKGTKRALRERTTG